MKRLGLGYETVQCGPECNRREQSPTSYISDRARSVSDMFDSWSRAFRDTKRVLQYSRCAEMLDRGARTFYSPLKQTSVDGTGRRGGKVICTLLSTARANRVQSCSDLVCVRKITSSTNYSLGSMSGDAICKNRYTVRSVHLSEQGCTWSSLGRRLIPSRTLAGQGAQ